MVLSSLGITVKNPNLLTSFVKGHDETMWFGTYQGIFKYDGRSVTLINDESLGFTAGNEQLHIRALCEDSGGNLWIGNNGLGVLLYDDQVFTNFAEKHRLSINEKELAGSLDRVFSIAEDANGNLWFGTRDHGAWRFNGESLRNYTAADGLTSTMVWTIYRDKRDDLWFEMGDGSVCRFNGESFKKTY